MTGTERILKWWEEGRLVRPSAKEPNFVDFTRALFRIAGVEGFEGGAESRRIERLIGEGEHYIFVLVDGMGTSLLEKAPAGGFLRSHVACEVQAVCPATTASALVTLATGEWPARHGSAGWWMYLAEPELSILPLPFVERFEGKSLGELGITAGDVFPIPSVWRRFKRQTLSVMGEGLKDSVFTEYFSGSTRRAGYGGIADAVETAVRQVRNAGTKTFTHIYLPQLDAQCHERGVADDRTETLLAVLDRALGEMAAEVKGQARVVVSADHGVVDTTEETRFFVHDDDEVMDCLIVPPTGEPTTPIFHVKGGREEEFAGRFEERFGEGYALLTPEESEHLGIYGPGPLSEVMRERLGTYRAFAAEPSQILYRRRGVEEHASIGVHGGLTRDEMYVPIIVA